VLLEVVVVVVMIVVVVVGVSGLMVECRTCNFQVTGLNLTAAICKQL